VFRSGVLLVLCLSAASAQQPAVPDTPAGRTFSAWLTAVNSGDKNVVAAYVQKYEPDRTVDQIMQMHATSGGFDLQQILESQRLHLQAIIVGHSGAATTMALVSLDVRDANPAAVTRFILGMLPPGTTAAAINMKIDAPTRVRVVDSAIADLDAFYVTPAVAKRMTDALRAHQKHGDYDTVTNGSQFADLLTSNLQDVSHDRHLRVQFTPVPMPPPPDTSQGNPIQANFRRFMLRTNCAFEKAEILPGNIGYIKFDGFAPPDICAPTASAAMSFVANADAIIFDLRENHGGDPDMVQFICSYLFDQPTHLNDLWTRKDSSTHQYWTLSSVPGKRLADKPAYVLTSKTTFSGGEEFTYDLKELKRATIVGETTGGGAHPVAGHRIDDRFMIGVPFATAINPISHTSWEGTGVEPDVKVPADSALATAEKLAADTLRATRQKLAADTLRVTRQ
jgi:peptidase S41-like protein